MFKVRVERLLTKDIDTVFEILSDHEGYTSFPGVTKAVLLEQGRDEKNGAGALREIGLGNASFLERITEFERPTRMCYQIESSKPLAMQHDKGEIVLSQEEGGTKVVWISEGRIKVPILGPLLFDKMIQKQAAAAFGGMLGIIEKR